MKVNFRLNSKKKILLVAPLGYMASIPFVMEIVARFAKSGYVVDLVVPSMLDPRLDAFENVNVVSISCPRFLNKTTFRKVALIYSYFAKTKKLIRASTYEYAFGLSQLGIIILAAVRTGRIKKLFYLNDELWYNDYESTRIYHLMKHLEILSEAKADITITQDKQRGRLLSVINKHSQQCLMYLPNSRSGLARRKQSCYLHSLLGEDRSKKIVLWIGAASEGDGALDVVKSAVDWPSDYLFVYHFRSKGILSEYKKKMIGYNKVGQNRYISCEFSYSDLEEVFGSAFVGVAYYPDRGINANYIGYSSGKINTFLKVGVPCIVSDVPGLRWVGKNGVGKAVSCTKDVLKAVVDIESDYCVYAKSAVAIYNKYLCFDKAFDHILKQTKVQV